MVKEEQEKAGHFTTAQSIARLLVLSPDQQEIAQEIEKDTKAGKLPDNPEAFLAALYNRLGHVSYTLSHNRDAHINHLFKMQLLPEDEGIIAIYANVREVGQIRGGANDGAPDLRPSIALVRKTQDGKISVNGPTPDMQERYRQRATKVATLPLPEPPSWTRKRPFS